MEKENKFVSFITITFLSVLLILSLFNKYFNSQKNISKEPIIIDELEITLEDEKPDLSLDDEKKELSFYQYGRNFLSDEEKKVYDEMLENAKGFKKSFYIYPISEKSLYKVYPIFLNDNPEIFWIENLQYYKSVINDYVVKIEFIYSVSETEKNKRQEQIDDVVDAIMKMVNQFENNYDKVKFIHDFIIINTEYDLKSSDNQNIYSVLVNGRSVCAGYARTFQYLMNKIGLYTLYIQGSLKNEKGEEINHAWNLASIDGKYYYFDVTWDDPTFLSKSQRINYVGYYYFGETTKGMEATHNPSELYPLPIADSTKYNYYVKENLIFNSYNDKVKKRLIEEFINQSNKKRSNVTFKFTNKEAYNKAIVSLFDKPLDITTIIREANKKTNNKIDIRNIKYMPSAKNLIIDVNINYQ
jgi:hypothetical protein